MKLSIQKITGHTPPEREKLIIKVLETVDLSEYVVINTFREENGFKHKNKRSIFVFPSVQANKGDKVVLYTEKGNYSSLKIEYDHVRHSFYWGLSKRLWRRYIGEVFIAHISSWESKRL